MRIIIGGAAGNVGHRVAELVIEAGAEAVLLVRNPARLSPSLTAQGTVLTVDMADTAAVVAASRGADALFWVVPPPVLGRGPLDSAPDWQGWYDAVGGAGAAAIRENRIPRAVLVSGLGAGMAPGLSTVSYVGDTERRFNETGAHVVHLRPGYFMQNFLTQADAIREQGVVTYPYAEDHDIPFISTQDIAVAAAQYLLDATWAGQWTRNLMGTRNLTLPECAAIIAKEWGRPVQYRRQSYPEVQQSLAQFGMSAYVQQQMTELLQALGDPNGVYATPRTPDAFTPTSFEEFVRAELLARLQPAATSA